MNRRKRVKIAFPKILIFSDAIYKEDFDFVKLKSILKDGNDLGVHVIMSSQINWLSDDMAQYFKSKILFWHYYKESADKTVKLSESEVIKPWEYVFQNGRGEIYKCKPIDKGVAVD